MQRRTSVARSAYPDTRNGLRMFSMFIRCSTLCLALSLAAPVQAGIVLNTTRVIYSGADKEVSFVVHNSGTADILAQSWLQTRQDSAESTDLPFVIAPPLARMSGNARQIIRIIYAGQGMPLDRESVLWLNVQEIPQTAKDNELQIAIRQRIKLFYRPPGLEGDPLKAAQGLQWRVLDGQLHVSNPGPYHVSMIQLDVQQRGKTLLNVNSQMLAPLQSLQLPLKPVAEGDPVELTFISINDFGAQEPYQANVLSDRSIQATKAASRPD